MNQSSLKKVFLLLAAASHALGLATFSNIQIIRRRIFHTLALV